ncbi:trypsin-like serine protease [Catellatospora sp. KI3]|uniref:trypsin-like serine peptidase n=1 Tax=Catellatospora sp. KI3 TaxID=3041620 RepID=UPI002482FB2D|nr:trypsin-like serine protease [Catellatospora sp. KI3]MDI1464446.1 trypsin-like serine protease [Catellatospora sp. KI3]
MSRRRIPAPSTSPTPLWGRGLLVAALLAATALSAAASPAAAAPEAAAPTGGVTMVNGAGKTITIPSSAFASVTRAGASGNTQGKGVTAGKSPLSGSAIGTGGTVNPDSVIGTDERIAEGAPTTYPWNAIVHLSTNQGGCTGFMLSRDVVVTAGHCVYYGGWVTSYRATPGKNGASEPYGSCSGGINDVWTTSDWISTGSPDHDYGLIKLTCDIGNTVGWFGWWYNTGETLTGQYFYVEGYPGDKPYATMWWDSDPISSQSATRVWYQIDTFNGQSGAPLYHYNSVTPGLCSGWCIGGIHTNGAVNNQNSGTRFNPTVMSFINYWINQP